MGKYSSMNEYVKDCFYEQRRSEIINIADRNERRKQIAENMYLFDKNVEPPKTAGQQSYTVNTMCGDFKVNQAGKILS